MFWYYISWSQSTTWMKDNNCRTYNIYIIYTCTCIYMDAIVSTMLPSPPPPPPPIHVAVIKEVSRHLLWRCNCIVLTRNVHMSWGTLFQIWGPICIIICVDANVRLFYLQLVWIELNVHEQWQKQQTPTCVVIVCVNVRHIMLNYVADILHCKYWRQLKHNIHVMQIVRFMCLVYLSDLKSQRRSFWTVFCDWICSHDHPRSPTITYDHPRPLRPILRSVYDLPTIPTFLGRSKVVTLS